MSEICLSEGLAREEIVARYASFGEVKLFIVTSRVPSSTGESSFLPLPVTKVFGSKWKAVTLWDAVTCRQVIEEVSSLAKEQ